MSSARFPHVSYMFTCFYWCCNGQFSAECLYVVSFSNLTSESKDCSNSLFKALFQVTKYCAVIEYVADDCMF